MSVNNVMLLGNVGRDPEFKILSNGQPVVNFTLATTDRWFDKDSGQQKEATEWHSVVAFRKVAELIERHVKKGSQVYVEGRLQTRSWEDKDSGKTMYVTEIVASNIQFLGKKEGGSRPPDYPDDNIPNQKEKDYGNPPGIDDNDCPF